MSELVVDPVALDLDRVRLLAVVHEDDRELARLSLEVGRPEREVARGDLDRLPAAAARVGSRVTGAVAVPATAPRQGEEEEKCDSEEAKAHR